MDGTAVLRGICGGPAASFGDGQDAVSAVAVAPDGTWFAAGTYGGRIVVQSPDGKTLASFEVSGGKPGTSFREQRQKVLALAVSPDGAYLAASAPEGSLLVFQTTDWSLHDRQPAGSVVAALSFGSDGTLFCGCWSGNVRRYDVRAKAFADDIGLGAGAVEDVATDAGRLVAVTNDGALLLWADQGTKATRRLGDVALDSVAFSPELVAAGGSDNAVYLLGGADLAERRVIRGFNDDISALAFARDSILLIGTARGELWAFDTKDGRLTRLGGQREASEGVQVVEAAKSSRESPAG